MTLSIPNQILSANDSSFETSVAGWSAGAGLALSQDATHVLDGAHSMKAQASATGALVASGLNGYGVSPLVEYSFGAPTFTALSGRSAFVTISWFTSSLTFISSSSGVSTPLNANTWSAVTVNAAAPANAAQAFLTITYNATANTDTFWSDWLAFVPGAQPVVTYTPFTLGSGASFPETVTSIAGDTLIVVACYNQGTTSANTSSLTDSAGNQWVKLGESSCNAGVNGSQGIAVWGCSNASAITTFTLGFSASISAGVVYFADLANAWCYDTSLIEFSAFAHSAGTATSIAPSITPNLVGDLIFNVNTSSAGAVTNSLGNMQAQVSTTNVFTAVSAQPLATSGAAVTGMGTAASGYMAGAIVALRAQPYINADIVNSGNGSIELLCQGLTAYDTITIARTNTLTGVSGYVRSAYNAAQVGDLAVPTDYEASLGVSNQFVITAVHHNLDGSTTSATSLPFYATIPWVAGEAWIKNLSQTNLNTQVTVVGPMADIVYPPLNTVYEVLGTPYPVAVGDVLRARTGTLTVLVETFAQQLALQSLVSSGQTLLFQAGPNDNFPDMYFVITNNGVTLHSLSAPSVNPNRTFDLNYTEVAPPIGAFSLLGANSWGQVLSFGTWQAVLNDRSTWLQVLNVQYGAGTPV